MSVVVDILVVLAVAVAGIVALALLMPISYRAVAGLDESDGLSWHARVAWGFGLVSFGADGEGTVVRVCGLAVRRRAWGEGTGKRPRRARRPKPRAKGRRGLRWFWARRRTLGAIAWRYVRALHVRGRIEGVIGLPDPDQNAVLHQALVVVDRVLPEGVIAVEVEWVDEVVALEGRLGGWVWPLQVVAITVLVLVAPTTRRALRPAAR